MSVPAPIGYVTLRIPILAVTESESWEIPEEYTYLSTWDDDLLESALAADKAWDLAPKEHEGEKPGTPHT